MVSALSLPIVSVVGDHLYETAVAASSKSPAEHVAKALGLFDLAAAHQGE